MLSNPLSLFERHCCDEHTCTHPHILSGALRAGVDGKKSHAGVDPADYRCLVRAVGAKQKISAMISAKDLKRFMQSYGNILKVSLDSLKRKEKKKPDMSKGKSTRAVIRKGGAS